MRGAVAYVDDMVSAAVRSRSLPHTGRRAMRRHDPSGQHSLGPVGKLNIGTLLAGRHDIGQSVRDMAAKGSSRVMLVRATSVKGRTKPSGDGIDPQRPGSPFYSDELPRRLGWEHIAPATGGR